MSTYNESNTQLIAAMATECREIMSAWQSPLTPQPPSLQLPHLAWMCTEVEKNQEKWQPTKLHRWIGFIQCGMIANRILDLDAAKEMFDSVREIYPDASEDLFDHLNPDDPFEVDIGGQG